MENEFDFEIKFRADGVELDEQVKEYAIKKIQSLKKLVNEQSDTPEFEVILEQDRPNEQLHTGKFRAHITVYAGALKMHAIGHGDTLQAALDEAKDELERRLRRDKKKKTTLFKKGARKIKEMLRWGKF